MKSIALHMSAQHFISPENSCVLVSKAVYYSSHHLSPVSITVVVDWCLTPYHNGSPVLSVSAMMHHTCPSLSPVGCYFIHVQRVWSSSVSLSLNSSCRLVDIRSVFGFRTASPRYLNFLLFISCNSTLCLCTVPKCFRWCVNLATNYWLKAFEPHFCCFQSLFFFIKSPGLTSIHDFRPD